MSARTRLRRELGELRDEKGRVEEEERDLIIIITDISIISNQSSVISHQSSEMRKSATVHGLMKARLTPCEPCVVMMMSCALTARACASHGRAP